MERSKNRDIVFYHSSSFEGDSLETRPLGGTETSEIYLSRYMAKEGLNVTIFCDCRKPGTYNGVDFINMKDFPSYSADKRIKTLISQTNLDIFSQNINADMKVFWTAGAYSLKAVQPLNDAGLRPRIDKFIFLSNWHADTFMKRFGIPKEKIFITRNGVNLNLFSDSSIEREKYRLIYSSSPTRGLDVLLDIFPKVRKDFPKLTLYLFSDFEFYGQPKGSAYIKYKHIFDKTRQPGIFNLGNIKQQDLAKELLRSYVFAYPSHFEETSCISAIEAQAAGVPVVTSALAALNETVEDGVSGALITGDSHSWWYKLKFTRTLKNILRDDDLWAKMSMKGIERARKTYSWEQIAKEWLKEFGLGPK